MPPGPGEATSIVREVRIEASPETVFPFFTDPEKMVRWKGVEAELRPEPGGAYRVDVDGGRHVVRGEYVEVDPPRRVVFTWGWESEETLVPPGTSTVEVELVPEGDATLVRLVHRDLPSGAQGPHSEGWDHYLQRLAVAAPGGDPGADPWAERPQGEA
jgi:uncharacterized protein YndB with AHSA1/START domain